MHDVDINDTAPADVRVTCDDWPRDGSTLTTATVEVAGMIFPVVLGLDPDAVGCGTRTCAAVYVADGNDWPDEIDAYGLRKRWDEISDPMLHAERLKAIRPAAAT